MKEKSSTANMKGSLSTASSNVIQELKSAFAALKDDFRSFSDKSKHSL